MNILKIRYFLAVAECASFSEAARRLYTAQPNLSKQVAQLESELGFPLFVRRKRSIQLTPAGAYLFERWKNLPDRVSEDVEQARLLSAREESITIGVLEGQDVNHVLLGRIMNARAAFPKYAFSLERNSYQNLRNGVRSGHYDLIITLDFDLEGETGLRTAALYQKVPAIAMLKTNPLAQKQDVSLCDLKNEDFVVISQEESPGGYSRLMESCKECGFSPRIVRSPRSLESLLLCVEMGMGIALLDQNTRLEMSPDIVTIPQDADPMAVVAAAREDDERPVVRRLMALLADETLQQDDAETGENEEL